MEIDLLLDVGAESLNCCSGWMERIIEKGLSSKNGRIGLILGKIVGLIFDVIAIIIFASGPSEEDCERECIAESEYGYADHECIEYCMGGGFVTDIGNCLITLFIFDRIFVIPLILIYGWNPETNEKYQAWINKYIAENEKITSKYGLTSLWYGALFNFPDFAAKQWIIDTQVICGNIGCIYISFVFLEGFTLLLFIVFSFSNFFFADNEYQQQNWSSNLVLGITSIAVGIGVVQHYMNIAYTLRNKSHYKSGIASSKKQKHVQIPVTTQQQIQYNQQQPMPIAPPLTIQQQQQPVIQQPVIQQPQQEQYMMVQMQNGQMVMVKTLPTAHPQYGFPPQPVMVNQQQPVPQIQPQQQQQVVYVNTQNTQKTHIPQDNMTTNNNNNINDGEHVRKEAVTCGDKCVYTCGSCCFYFCLIFAGCYGLTFCGLTLQALIWMCLAFV